MATVVVAAAPVDLRSTVYGIFNVVSGIAILNASARSALAWDQFGASFTFIASAAFDAIALAARAVVGLRMRAAEL